MVDLYAPKGKAKRTKPAKARTVEARDAPTTGAETRVDVSLQSMMLLMKLIEEQGHVLQFLSDARAGSARISMDAASIDFVKEYVRANALRDKVTLSAADLFPPMIEFAARTAARDVVDPFPDDPFEMFKR